MADAELEEVWNPTVTDITGMLTLLTLGDRSGELALRSSSNKVVVAVAGAEGLPRAGARKNRSE